MLSYRVERIKESYNYRANPNLPDSFENNWANNSLDFLILLDDEKEIIRLKCQTVANYCFGEHLGPNHLPHISTIATGEFVIKSFVEPRSFHGEIHAITKTRDKGGRWIDHNAMMTLDNGYQTGRWLIHDKYSFNHGRDTNYAWSAGCFILSSKDLKTLNLHLKQFGVKPGDLINGVLNEQ
ncbi:MAG: hypothetical protein LBC80_05455 [Treponema sp.]|jgi:hypothetical protein|nr:hypothetical protein [Treponema sp.]